MMKVIALGIASLVLATPLFAQTPPSPIFFDDVTVFDGERLVGQRDVLVRDGRIVTVSPQMTPPEAAVVIDGRGRTLLPGLLDSHVHAFPSAAADAIRFGVTTEFDMFGHLDPATVASRRSQRSTYGSASEADVWSAGRGVTLPGAHPTQVARGMGWELPTLPEDGNAAAFVSEEVREGSDYIKIFQDSSAIDGRARFPEYSRAQLGRIIAAAHANGVKAIVHVSTQDDAMDAIGLGGDALAHMFDDEAASPAFVALAVERRAVVIATLSVLAGAAGDGASARLAADPRVAEHLSPMQRGMLAQPFSRTDPAILVTALESVRRLNAAGVIILAGTDAPNPTTAHGPSIHAELELLVRAGLTPSQALAAATSRPARFFGLSDRGRIGEGLRADLLLVDGDPTTEITATRSIIGIWKNGRPIDRARIPAMPAMPAR